MDFLEGESEEETPAPVSKKTCAKQQSKPLVSVCVCVCCDAFLIFNTESVVR